MDWAQMGTLPVGTFGANMVLAASHVVTMGVGTIEETDIGLLAVEATKIGLLAVDAMKKGWFLVLGLVVLEGA
jgi:hypothetical protein